MYEFGDYGGGFCFVGCYGMENLEGDFVNRMLIFGIVIQKII